MTTQSASIRNSFRHLLRHIAGPVVVLVTLVGVRVPLPAQSAAAVAPRALALLGDAVTETKADTTSRNPWRFDRDVVLRVPGSSRYAGAVYGVDSVRARLAELGQLADGDSAVVELYSTQSGRQLVLARATLQVGAARRGVTHVVQLVAIPTFDTGGAVRVLDVFIDDLAALDRRAPRDDGVRTASLAMQRNLEQVRALYGRGGAARFIAANAHQVVVLFDESSDSAGTHATVIRYAFDAAGRVKQVERFTPSGLVATALRNTRR